MAGTILKLTRMADLQADLPPAVGRRPARESRWLTTSELISHGWNDPEPISTADLAPDLPLGPERAPGSIERAAASAPPPAATSRSFTTSELISLGWNDHETDQDGGHQRAGGGPAPHQ